MKDETIKKIVDVMGTCFIYSIPVLFVGCIVDDIFKTKIFTTIGLLLFAPIMIGIVFALAAFAAEAVSNFAGKFIGKGLATRIIFWVVLVVIFLAFLFVGTPDSPGPTFWGSV